MISLENISKRYDNAWIFKNITLQFAPGKHYALLGDNGSGKSTLLRVIANMQSVNNGKIHYKIKEKNIAPEHFYKHYTFCAPAMDIIEDMTLVEFLQFHFSFKQSINNIHINDIIEATGLQDAKNNQIRNYSSGMKQRVKLAQAFFSQSDYLLLDEPCSNLDDKGIALYQEWLKNYGSHNCRTVIIASNDSREYADVDHLIYLKTYK